MKYKVGDRVRIKDDIDGYIGVATDMKKWCGKVMTIKTAETNAVHGARYKMDEDWEEWGWYEYLIAGLAEEPQETATYTEVLQQAIDTYGEDEQIRVVVEEMAELTVALSKYHRYGTDENRECVVEEIADVQIMLDQAKLIFGEDDVEGWISKKIRRLQDRLKDEENVEVISGKHKINGKTYTWINPDKVKCEVGEIVIADTEVGHAAVIVTSKWPEKFKDAKHHRKIICRGNNWEEDK